MSQEKVDFKKDQKKNRKKIVRKRKVEYVISMVVVSVICVAIVGWIGYSVYTKATAYAAANHEYNYYEVDTDSVQDYISGIAE